LELIQEVRERNWAAGLFLWWKKQSFRNGRHTDIDEMRGWVQRRVWENGEETSSGLSADIPSNNGQVDEEEEEDGDEEDEEELFFDAPEA
jgi:hypothetical protein